MLQGSVQDRNNGDRDRHDEEWNQPVEDSHWMRALRPSPPFRLVCVARQSLTRTWRRIGSYLAESCESGCCVHVVYVHFPALRLLHVFAVRLVECYSRTCTGSPARRGLCAHAASAHCRVKRPVDGCQRGRTYVGLRDTTRTAMSAGYLGVSSFHRNVSWVARHFSRRVGSNGGTMGV